MNKIDEFMGVDYVAESLGTYVCELTNAFGDAQRALATLVAIEVQS